MQQMAEAESVSTVGTPEKIISALNKYIGVEITHFFRFHRTRLEVS
jgi:hypothetical protein